MKKSRINELAIEAGFNVFSSGKLAEHDEIHKFAKLLLKEVIKVNDSEVVVIQEQSGIQSGWFAMGMTHSSEVIKKYFGL
jgi:hypothetical protein